MKIADIVRDYLPLGNHEWHKAYADYRVWANETGYLERDCELFKQRFDRMAKEKKQTGNPSCPAYIKKAKHVPRNILGRANAVSLGRDYTDEDSADDGTIDLSDETNTQTKRLGMH